MAELRLPRMRFFTCLLTLGVLTAAAFAAIGNDASTIDKLRQTLLHLEKDLIKDLDDVRKWANAETKEKYLYLIRAYQTFGNGVDERFPRDRPDHLDSLDSSWLWARAKVELDSVNGLYEVFRQMQREVVHLNAPINMKQLVNFAETILRDPNASVPRMIDRVASIIINEKLFVAAFQVSISG